MPVFTFEDTEFQRDDMSMPEVTEDLAEQEGESWAQARASGIRERQGLTTTSSFWEGAQ